jgi:trehalose-6-phosphatase
MTDLVAEHGYNVRDAQGKVTHPDYPETWRRRMVQDAGERIKVHPLPGEPTEEP